MNISGLSLDELARKVEGTPVSSPHAYGYAVAARLPWLDQEKAETNHERHDQHQEKSATDRMMRALMLPQGILIGRIIEHGHLQKSEALVGSSIGQFRNPGSSQRSATLRS
jgi:hypothetical protein